jgi:phospho-N-acetylmuramoyl-pentapeptide-transferase
MLYPLLSPYLGQPQLFAICALFCFLLTTVLLHVDLPFLPKDQGRVNAVNGELSKGKVRGVGVVMMICFVACAALFIPFSLEFMFYALLLLAEMFSGYLDDASKLPWSDYQKGLIDFVISVLVGVVFVLNDSTTIYFGTFALTLHPVLYGALATVLVWVSINAVNCTDGVDGLSTSVGLVSLLSFLVIYPNELTMEYHGYILLFAAVIVSYLLFNAGPSKVLMGDAGSRMLGLAIGVAVLATGNPLLILVFAPMVLANGGTGLVKILLLRFFRKLGFDTTPTNRLPPEKAAEQLVIIKEMHKVRFPLHDHCRKNLGWTNAQVLMRFVLIQSLLIPFLFALFTKVR